MIQLKKINSKIISSFIMLLITASLLVAVSFAWFSQNKDVGTGGMTVAAMDERITVGSELRLVRKIGEKTVGESLYRCDNYNNVYYLWEDGSFSKDESGNMIPITVSNLLPGEKIELVFNYTCTDSLIGENLEIYFDNISSDNFFEQNEDGSDGAFHSVLCVYKCSFKKGEGDYSEGKWLANSAPSVSDNAPTRFDIAEEVWERVSETPESNYNEVAVQIEFDLAQYYMLRASTNQLSEKSFTIGALRIGVAKDD